MTHMNFPPPTDHQAFERLLEELAPATLNCDVAHVNGRTGQVQAGVDVNVRMRNGDIVGIQCKLTKGKLSFVAVRGEIEKARAYRPSLVRLIIATTANADAKLQEEVRQLPPENFSVEIWFWPYINNQLNRSPGLALDYVQRALVGWPGDAERQHAEHLQVAMDRPAFLHDEDQEWSFIDQAEAVKDTLNFLRTGHLYTRNGLLVSALPYRRYDLSYAKQLEKVINAVDRMDRHLSANRHVLSGAADGDLANILIRCQIRRLEVIEKVNSVLTGQGLEPLRPR